jgi:hypothetical protein
MHETFNAKALRHQFFGLGQCQVQKTVGHKSEIRKVTSLHLVFGRTFVA